MYYTTKELSELLRYKTPRTFLHAIRGNKVVRTEFLQKIWDFRIPAKVGRRILWDKEEIDKVLKELKN